jgi:hypothetical protein
MRQQHSVHAFFIAFLILLILCQGCSSCESSNNDCDKCEQCDDDFADDDDDDDDDNDDDDTTVQAVVESAQYVAGGTFSGAALAMSPAGDPVLATGQSRHLRTYRESGGAWGFELAAFGSFANPSVAIGSDGSQHLAYYDWYGGFLWYATDASGSWVSRLIDDNGDMGHYSAIALDPNGFVHIAYTQELSREPIACRYATNTGGQFETEVIAAGTGLGSFPSIAVNSQGVPFVTYNDLQMSEVRIAQRTDSGWASLALEHGRPYNRSSGVAIDTTDALHVAYRANHGTLHLRYAAGNFDDLTSEIVDDTVTIGDSTSIAVDDADAPHIAYFNADSFETLYASNSGKGWAIQSLGTGYPVAIGAASADNVAISIGDFGLYANATGVWSKTLIDTGYRVNACALAVDTEEVLHVAFFDQTLQFLHYATNASGVWETESLAGPVGDEARFVDIATDTNDAAHISFYDGVTHQLRYATNSSGAWVFELVDDQNIVGTYNSIVIDPYGDAHIAYYDETLGDLKYATNESGAWHTFRIQESGVAGLFGDITIDVHGHLAISYANLTDSSVGITAGAAATWTLETVDQNFGTHTSAAVSPEGDPVVAWFGAGLMYATKNSGQWQTHAVDGTALSASVSLEIDAAGTLAIAYQSIDSNLSYAYGTKGALETLLVDDLGEAGQSASLAIGASGRKYVASVAQGAIWLATIE